MGHFLVWIIAPTVLCSIHLVSTIFYQPSYQPDALTASLYACTYRIIIAAATGTILIGCALGHGGKSYAVSTVYFQKSVSALQH